MRSRYVYALVMFQPNKLTGEFINVGAIVGSDEKEDWCARRVENLGHAARLDERGSLDGFKPWFDSEIAGTEWSEKRLRHRAGSTGNAMSIFSITGPIPMLTSSAEAGIARIFETQIIEPAPKSEGKRE